MRPRWKSKTDKTDGSGRAALTLLVAATCVAAAMATSTSRPAAASETAERLRVVVLRVGQQPWERENEDRFLEELDLHLDGVTIIALTPEEDDFVGGKISDEIAAIRALYD